MAKVTLAHKKNFKDNEAKRDDWLNQIAQLTGIHYTVEVKPSIEAVLQAVVEKDQNSASQAGERIYGEYLEAIHRTLKRDLADDMVKEAWIDATKDKRKIVFELFDGVKLKWDMKKVFQLVDGCIMIRAQPTLQNLDCYVYETKLEDLL